MIVEPYKHDARCDGMRIIDTFKLKVNDLQFILAEVPNVLKAFQQLVGGYIETLTLEKDPAPVCAIVNEEGMFNFDTYLTFRTSRMRVDLFGPVVLFGGTDGDGEMVDVNLSAALSVVANAKKGGHGWPQH